MLCNCTHWDSHLMALAWCISVLNPNPSDIASYLKPLVGRSRLSIGGTAQGHLITFLRVVWGDGWGHVNAGGNHHFKFDRDVFREERSELSDATHVGLLVSCLHILDEEVISLDLVFICGDMGENILFSTLKIRHVLESWLRKACQWQILLLE